MAERLTVLLLIPHLGGGGAEQVAALLARGLSRQKYDLHLGLITESAPSADLPSWVTVHPLGASRVRASALPLLRLVRRLRPDLILSGMAHLNFLVLLLRPFFPAHTRILIRQNATVSAALASSPSPSSTRLLYRLLYPHADRIICQSAAMAADLQRQFRLDPSRIAILPNPIDFQGILAAAESPEPMPGPGPHLLAVGRLAPEKGFDLLLHALVSVRSAFPTADLTLLGAGPQESALKSLAQSLALQSAVRFAGHVDSPYRYFPAATLFVLSSRHDALPSALLEAAAAGLPLVALPASGGVSDLLRNLPGAWLAPQVSAPALAETLVAALQALRPGQRFPRAFAPVPFVSPPQVP